VLKVFLDFSLLYKEERTQNYTTQEEHPIHHSLCHIVFCKV